MELSKGFISVFMYAISNCMLYSKNHAFIDELIEIAFSKLGDFLKGTDHFEIMIIENDLIINKNPAIGIGLQGKNLIKRFKRKGISHIEFSKGITLQELKKLVADISSMEKDLKATPHIKIGIVDLHLGGFTSDRDSSTEKRRSTIPIFI